MKISVKKQTKRATRWIEPFADNINVFCNLFQIGIITTQDWGDFRQGNEPKIEITLSSGREDYSMSLSEFEYMIRAHAEEFKK